MRRLLPVVFVFVMLSLTACAGNGPTVTINNQTFTVDVADDRDEQIQGLMFVEEMAEDHGMLFLFNRMQPRSFWMKNTKISLDILYFDNNWRFVSGHYQVPPCRARQCPSYPSKAPAQYVLELNGGRARSLNLKAGDQLLVDLD